MFYRAQLLCKKRQVQKCVQAQSISCRSMASAANILSIPSTAQYTPSTTFIKRNLCSSKDDKMSFEDTIKKMKQKTNLDSNESPAGNNVEATSNVANDGDKEAEEGKEEKKDSENADNGEEEKEESNEAVEKAGFSWSSFADSVTGFGKSIVDAVKERIKEQPEVEKTNLRRKIHQAVTFRRTSEGLADEEGEEDAYDGPSALVHVATPLTAWESMRARLSSSPLIHDIMKRSSKVRKAAQETSVGRTVERGANVIQDKIEDAREYWETTQNPLVYSMAGAWENVSGETEEGACIRDFQKLDPHFSKEEWAAEVQADVVPAFIRAHLIGNMSEFKHMMGEALYNKLMADIRIRKQEGLSFDPTILDVDERQITLKYPEGAEAAYIIGHYAVQQIFCVKNRQGEIIEGDEGDIRMRIYTLLFQQTMEEKEINTPSPKNPDKIITTTEHYMQWRVVDYQFGEMIPYL